MSVPDPSDLILREIATGDVVTGLSLGDPAHQPLKNFLRRHAKEYHRCNLSKTYVLVDKDSKVWAYISLTSSQVELDGADRPQDADDIFPFKVFPAVKITRLARDRRLEGTRVGLYLVDVAVALVKNEISPRVGCRFIVADAKRDAITFYTDRAGFTLLDTGENRARECPVVFLDLQRLT